MLYVMIREAHAKPTLPQSFFPLFPQFFFFPFLSLLPHFSLCVVRSFLILSRFPFAFPSLNMVTSSNFPPHFSLLTNLMMCFSSNPHFKDSKGQPNLEVIDQRPKLLYRSSSILDDPSPFSISILTSRHQSISNRTF